MCVRFYTVAQYTSSPLIGGYIHKTDIKRVANSAAILLCQEGQGRVLLFSDNPNFRGTWYGTNKLFLNALFFGSLISPPNNFGEEKAKNGLMKTNLAEKRHQEMLRQLNDYFKTLGYLALGSSSIDLAIECDNHIFLFEIKSCFTKIKNLSK